MHNLCTAFAQSYQQFRCITLYRVAGHCFRVSNNADFAFSVAGDCDIIAGEKCQMVHFIGAESDYPTVSGFPYFLKSQIILLTRFACVGNKCREF